MQIEPEGLVGTETIAMVIVICPKCKQKRWANKCTDNRGMWKGEVRTTCCGHKFPIRGKGERTWDAQE